MKKDSLPVVRSYKNAEHDIYGFAPYERRVIITCFHPAVKGTTPKEKFRRYYVRLDTARRRLMDLAMDHGQVGEMFEVSHVTGLQFCTLKIETNGEFTIKLNPKVFKIW